MRSIPAQFILFVAILHAVGGLLSGHQAGPIHIGEATVELGSIGAIFDPTWGWLSGSALLAITAVVLELARRTVDDLEDVAEGG